jgi:hypothetical protein
MSYDILEEIQFGDKGSQLRLVQSHHSPRTYIQSYSSLSKQWNNMVSYNVDEEWLRWKKIHASVHARKQENERNLGRDDELGRSKAAARKRTRRKASVVNPKDSRRTNGKQGHESSGRVQRSTKKN